MGGARAAVQLAAVAGVLAAALTRLWSSMLVLAVMFVVASVTAARRSQASRGSALLKLSLACSPMRPCAYWPNTGEVPAPSRSSARHRHRGPRSPWSRSASSSATSTAARGADRHHRDHRAASCGCATSPKCSRPPLDPPPPLDPHRRAERAPSYPAPQTGAERHEKRVMEKHWNAAHFRKHV